MSTRQYYSAPPHYYRVTKDAAAKITEILHVNTNDGQATINQIPTSSTTYLTAEARPGSDDFSYAMGKAIADLEIREFI